MKKNTKINFLLSYIRSLSILLLSAGIYIFCLYYVEIINSLQKKEYLTWINCTRDERLRAFNDSLKEGWNSEVLTNKIDEYIKACSNKPKRWKLQSIR